MSTQHWLGLRVSVMRFWVVLVVIGLGTLAGCSKQEPAPSKAAAVSYVNKVWQVSESKTVAPGSLYVFLSEGTLVVASPRSTPLLGSWKPNGANLVMTEHSLPYQVQVLSLSAEQMKIRILNPGEPVEITLVPAAG